MNDRYKPLSYRKNHIYAMYKFLSKYSNPNTKKQMESKLAHANQCDIESLIKFMSARNGSEGLRKLYKLMSKLFDDLIIYASYYSNNGYYADKVNRISDCVLFKV